MFSGGLLNNKSHYILQITYSKLHNKIQALIRKVRFLIKIKVLAVCFLRK